MQPWPIAHPLMALALVVIMPYLAYVAYQTYQIFKQPKSDSPVLETEFQKQYKAARKLFPYQTPRF